MYAVGDKVLYSSIGVMEIVDIVDMTVADETKKYYVMKEYASMSTSLTYVPLDNEILISNIKPILKKDEVVDVIRAAKSAEPIEWIEDNRARSENYKKILASLDRVRIMAMIDTIAATGRRREEEGKKNYIADETSMKKAEKLISTEFSLALGISESEVSEFIENVK